MALLLVFELRLWDDLCDVDFDRQAHPERVLCQAASVRPFWRAFFVLAAINFGLAQLFRGFWAVAILVGLHLLLACWYGLRGAPNSAPIMNYHVVLLKYPVVVWMLGAQTAAELLSASLAISAVMVYVGLCVFETLHDGRLWRLPLTRVCLAVEFVLLAALGCWAVSSAGWLLRWP